MAVHGVEDQEVQTGPVQVTEVPSAITLLVGIAPKGPIESLIRVSGPADAAQFGELVPGFDIPSALDTHFAEKGKDVLVVNVFDPTLHTSAVTDEAVTLVEGKAKLQFAPIANIIVTHTTGTPVYVLADYKIDAFGNVRTSGNGVILHNQSIKISYKKLNAAAVTAATIKGTIDGTTLRRTGYQLAEKANQLHLVEPRIFTSPGFSHLSAVAVEMLAWAIRYKGKALIDAPIGTTVPLAIAGRGAASTINFGMSDERLIACFPRVNGYDPATDSWVPRPLSQFVSGIIGRVSNDLGIQYSISNQKILSGRGTDIEMTGSATQSGTDAEKLNDAGILTVIQEGASGLRLWGNYSTAWPSSTKITSFHAVRNVQDIAVLSIKKALVQYSDLPMIGATRDAILETANSYLRELQQRDALIDGTALFETGKNPVSQTAQGWWVLSLRSCAPPPLQRLTILSYVDIQLLSKSNDNQAA